MSSSASNSEAWLNLRQRIADLVASGRTDAIETLLTEHPDLRSQEQLLLDCIYAEFCFREERDQQPRPAEYLKRFPEHTKQLQALFEVHAALDTPSLLGAAAGAGQQSGKKPPDDDPTLLPTELAKPSATMKHESSRRIGPYKLLQLIGEGGMGAVYMADQLEPVRRRVALKLIKSGMDSKQVVARFEAERQALAMMDHQHIAKVLDAGITEDGTPYFAMELVQGMPITKYCDREKLSIADRMKLFVQVCRALQHAHQKGVIHRDIKPTNVLVTQRDGVPVAKVIDFGLAKALQSEHRLTDKTLFTEVGQVCGTLEYMSPEQAEMNELGLDTRTDVYSLGVLLYELLTGSTPLGHDRIRKEAFHRVLQLILTEEAPRPSRRLSDSGEAITGISDQRRIEPRRLSGILKRELDWIALKALEKDRNRRYDGAGTLADDVQNYLTGDVVTARPPSTGYRLRKAIRKHKAAFVSGTVFVLLLVAGLIGTGSMWLRASTAELRARDEATNAIAAEVVARAAEATAAGEKRTAQLNLITAEKNAYYSNMLLAQRDWEENNIVHLRELLNRYRNREDLKGFEWDYWDRLSNTELLTLEGHTSIVSCLSFSPDGKRIVSGSWDNTVKVWDAESGDQQRTLKGHTSFIRDVSFSPDGKRIVSGSDDSTVKVWDAETGQEILTLKGHTANVISVNFSPDGKRIVSGSDDDSVKLWDAETGQEVLTVTGYDGRANDVSFSPDGKRIVSGCGGYTVEVWDAETGQEMLTLEGHSSWVTSVNFSPDGKRIVSGSSDATVKLWDAETGHEGLTLKGHTGDVTSVNFSPDGKQIVSGSYDNTVKVWDVETGHETLSLKGHARGVYSVSFSPDGKRVISAGGDNTVKVWDAKLSQAPLTRKIHSSGVSCVNFSPDGKRIVSGSHSDRPNSPGEIRLWDVETGHEPLTFKGLASGVGCVSFSPDGKRIVSGGGWYNESGEIKVWNAETGHETLRLNSDKNSVNSVSFSPDGKRIVSGSYQSIGKVWDAETGQEMFTLLGPIGLAKGVSFSSDGKRIIGCGIDGAVKVWDAETGHDTLTLNGNSFGVQGHSSSVSCVSFSPDGKRIVCGSHDNTLEVLDVETGHEMLTLTGHASGVTSVSFSPDGKRIVSGSGDSTVKLWDAETGHETLTLNGHVAQVTSVSFSPDGKRIVSGSDDSTVKVWDAQPWTAEQRTSRQQVVEVISSELTAGRLTAVAWDTVCHADSMPAVYETALSQIHAAVELEPESRSNLCLLGVAQYRVGDYQAALTTLTRVEQLCRNLSESSWPVNLVFLAMTNQRLGNVDQARVQLQQVRELSQGLRGSRNRELQGFLQEAEALIEPDPPPETKAADPATPP